MVRESHTPAFESFCCHYIVVLYLLACLYITDVNAIVEIKKKCVCFLAFIRVAEVNSTNRYFIAVTERALKFMPLT